MVGSTAWTVLCVILLSFIMVGGVCIADESEKEVVVDVDTEAIEAPAQGTTSSATNLDDWVLVTINDLYEVMLPPGWSSISKELETGTVTGIISESNPDDMIVIAISENDGSYSADKASLQILLESYMKEAKVTPVSGEEFIYTDDYSIGLGTGEDNKTEIIVFRVTDDYLITVVGSYETLDAAKEGALTLGMITGTIAPF